MGNKLRVIIAAAGLGSRMKSDINKQYMLLAGKPVLYHSLKVFNEIEVVDEIIVVAHLDEIDYCQKNIIDKYEFAKVTKLIPGGKERQESVRKGLENLDSKTNLVAVHDGARPLLESKLVMKIYDEAREHGAAIPGVLAKETLKIIDNNNFIKETLDRSHIVTIQTPQIFNYQELVKAYHLATEDNFKGTDDASIYEKYVGKVKLVIGDSTNIKITNPEDIIFAEQLMLAKNSELR